MKSFIEKKLEAYDNLFGEEHHKICEGKKCVCMLETKELIYKALTEQKKIIMKCYDNSISHEGFLEKLKNSGL